MNITRKKKIVLGLLLLLLIAGGIYGYIRYQQQSQPSVPAETYTVTRRTITSHVTATGTISPLEFVEVSSKITARLQDVLVHENDIVKKGQIIARLDDSDYRAKRDQAQIKVRQTGEVYQRALTLYRHGAGAKQAVDTAKAEYDAARSALTEAQADLNETIIRASMDGVVVGAPKSVGTLISQGNGAGTVIMRLANTTQKQIIAKIDETDIGHIKPGQMATFTVDAYPNKTFTARVQKIAQTDTNNTWDRDNTDRASTNTPVIYYEVTLLVTDPDTILRLGMTARVAITTSLLPNVLTLPLAALQTDASGSYVTRIMPDGRHTRVPVITGLSSDKYIEIRNGLKEGDVVSLSYAAAAPSMDDEPLVI